MSSLVTLGEGAPGTILRCPHILSFSSTHTQSSVLQLQLFHIKHRKNVTLEGGPSVLLVKRRVATYLVPGHLCSSSRALVPHCVLTAALEGGRVATAILVCVKT